MKEKGQLYCKYIYWFEQELPQALKGYLEKNRLKLYRARERPCEILYYRRAAALCPPQAWSRACRRQGSWYRESDRTGTHLMAFNEPLPESLGSLVCRITIEKFIPPKRASRKEAEVLVQQAEFQRKIPKGWDRFDPKEEETLKAYYQSLNLNIPLEEAFLFYSANHANFIKPLFFEKRKGEIVPYSIEDTPLLCSACVELFGILGQAFRNKFVRKCPGLYYVDMEPDECFRVEMFSAPEAGNKSSSPLS